MNPEEAIRELRAARTDFVSRLENMQTGVSDLEIKITRIDIAFIELKLKNNICKHMKIDMSCGHIDKKGQGHYRCNGDLSKCVIEQYKVGQ